MDRMGGGTVMSYFWFHYTNIIKNQNFVMSVSAFYTPIAGSVLVGDSEVHSGTKVLCHSSDESNVGFPIKS